MQFANEDFPCVIRLLIGPSLIEIHSIDCNSLASLSPFGLGPPAGKVPLVKMVKLRVIAR